MSTWGDEPQGGQPGHQPWQQSWQQPSAPPQPPAAWSPSPPSWAPPPSRPPQQKLWPAFLVIALLAAATGATYWFVARDDSPSYPSEWDSRVTDLVAFVEEERNLSFHHPVEIEFLDDDAWEKEMTTDPGTVSEDDAQDAEDFVAEMRALGLMSGDVDLLEETNDLQVSGVLALYDFEAKEIRVHAAPDAELTIGTRGTLVHELTHVIQDQNFDLDEMAANAGDDDIVFDALTEGDASNVERAWYDKLSDDDKAKYDAEFESAGDELDAVDAPPVLETIFGAPYALGPPFAQLLAAESTAALDDAYEDLPSGDEVVFSPEHYLAGDTREIVAKPAVPEGAREIDDGAFGPLGWYIMLSERIDAHQAFTAARGFGGDNYVEYEDHDETCVRIRYTGESGLETVAMKGAIDAWIASLPTPFARVTQDGDELLFES
ncbi:MAG TPA: hypothetical protein VFX21_07665, partial [Acidimicrobiia bacterium]|nr:hypothetical protein [Acidimicrobiia bacterium]